MPMYLYSYVLYTCARTSVEKSMEALKLSTRSLTRSMCPPTTASSTEFIPSCRTNSIEGKLIMHVHETEKYKVRNIIPWRLSKVFPSAQRAQQTVPNNLFAKQDGIKSVIMSFFTLFHKRYTTLVVQCRDTHSHNYLFLLPRQWYWYIPNDRYAWKK